MPLLTTMVCAALVTAQFVSGKATRDALFLTSMDVTSLPAMLIATSVCSILLVALNGRLARTIRPVVLVPAAFALSGALFLAEWLLRSTAPEAAAVAVYLHISGAGPLLASGFWLITSERFDPRTAKRRFGQIAGAGTLGGLLSALVAERVAAAYGAPAMLLVLAGLLFLTAGLVWRLAADNADAANRIAESDDLPVAPSRSGLKVVAETPHLRNLAWLVLLGTTGAALVDYLFKAQAVEAFGRGDQLLRFFALFYAGTSLLTFILQTSSSRLALERFGLGATAGTPSVALLAGSVGGLLVPGFGSVMVARGSESVFRSSLFRAGYELFYTPIPAADKRAAKSLIDVGFDRLGDAMGGGLVRAIVILLPTAVSPAILSLAIACSVGALIAASRLNRGYVGSLETSLMNQANGVEFPADPQTKSAALTTRSLMRSMMARNGLHAPAAAVTHPALDPEMQDILSLRSRDRDRVVAVLSRAEGMAPGLVAHVIPLLAWDLVSNHAMFALRKVAEEHVGALSDALIDPNQDFAIRRRLARVFSVCVSDRAAQAALLGLDDIRFDVRCQAARSLAAIVEKNPRIAIDRERIFEVILREVAVGRPVWESRRLLDGFASDSPLDVFVRDRAGESLAHVFTLLSLVLPREPLQIAFRSLQTDDAYLRGTALEYLEGVLPLSIRHKLWPFLEAKPAKHAARPSDTVIADLLRSNHSVLLNLEDLRKRAALEPVTGA